MSCTTFARLFRGSVGHARGGSRRAFRARSRAGSRPGSRSGAILGAVLVLGLLGGCAEDEPGPVFANQTPERDAVPTVPATPVRQATPSPAASPVDPAALLVPRGAPTRIYFREGRRLATLAADGGPAATVLDPGAEAEIRAFSPSPNGDRVAVAVAEPVPGGERTSLVVLDAAGTELRRAPGVEEVVGGTGGGARATALDWAPQGEQLLVTFAPGGLVTLPVTGDAAPTLLLAAADPPVAGGAWSPTGEAVAYLRPVAADGPASLYQLAVGQTPPSPAVLREPGEGRSVGGFAWTPDGLAILYAEGTAPGGTAAGGDLWRITRDGDRRLEATAGGAGHVAEVRLVRPSPSGRAVAFVVAAPAGGGARFNGLRVSKLGSTQVGVPIPVPPDQAVTDLWWTAAGLVFRTVPGGAFDDAPPGAPFALYRADGRSEPVRIFSGAPAAATPAASPAAGAGRATAVSAAATPADR